MSDILQHLLYNYDKGTLLATSDINTSMHVNSSGNISLFTALHIK